jgi:hypothetical protein
MSKSPGVVLERKGGEVRLRGLKWPLPVALDTETKGRIRATIYPNKWNRVSDEIYDFLKGKFDSPRYTTVPDVEANEKNPHKPGDEPIMREEEVDRDYYLEFKER